MQALFAFRGYVIANYAAIAYSYDMKKSHTITEMAENEALAFIELCDGLRLGRDRDELSRQIEIVRACQDRAEVSPEIRKELFANLHRYAQETALDLEKLKARSCYSKHFADRAGKIAHDKRQ